MVSPYLVYPRSLGFVFGPWRAAHRRVALGGRESNVPGEDMQGYDSQILSLARALSGRGGDSARKGQ